MRLDVPEDPTSADPMAAVDGAPSPNVAIDAPSESSALLESEESARCGENPVDPATTSLEQGTARSGADLPLLTRCCRVLGVLALLGGSVGYFLAVLSVPGDLANFVIDNQIGDFSRRAMLIGLFGGAASGLGLGLAVLAVLLTVRRLDRVVRLEEIVRRVSPLALAGFLPLLFNWKIWSGRELNFLFLVAGFSLAVWASFRAALSSPPLTLGLPRLPIPGRLEPSLLKVKDLWCRMRGWRLGWLPLALVLVGVAGYVALFSWFTINFHHNLQSSSFDLGLEENLLWNAFHLNGFCRSTPFNGPANTHFGNHATFFAYLLAPIYGLWPHTETVLVLQAFLIGSAAIPLFLFARRHLGPWAACLIAFCYLLYPPVHGANLYEFHYLPLGAVFLWSALYLLESKRDVLGAVAVLLALSVREDVGAGVAIIGAYLLLSGQRPRAGLLLAAVGVVHVCSLKLFFMPLAAGEESFTDLYRGLLPAGKHGFGDILKTVLGNPGFTLGTLLERDKLFYLLQFFVPLAFLPLRRPIVLLLLLPGFFFTLISTGYPPLIQTSFQYTFHWTVYLFIGLVAALSSPPQGEAGPRAASVYRGAALAALAFSLVPVSYQLGAVFQQHTARGGFRPYQFDTTPQDLEARAALRQIVRQIPPMASVAAAENLVPQIAARPAVYTLRQSVYDAEYLFFWTNLTRHFDPEQRAILEGLRSGTFGLVAIQEPFGLARRGTPPVLNNQLLQRWGVGPMVPAGATQPTRLLGVPQFGR